MRGKVFAVLVTAALLCGACSSAPTANGTGTSGDSRSLAARRVPLPAGKNPSEIAKMVCTRHVQHELVEVLGVTPLRVTTPTWRHDLYSCTFEYRNGSFTLSVKERSSWAQTLAYFTGLGTQLGNTGPLQPKLGQGAFQTTDGSVVVRKDWKVLLVDVSGLPAHFGVPATTSADVGVSIADLILGCWSGD